MGGLDGEGTAHRSVSGGGSTTIEMERGLTGTCDLIEHCSEWTAEPYAPSPLVVMGTWNCLLSPYVQRATRSLCLFLTELSLPSSGFSALGCPLGKNRLRCSVLPPFASLPCRSPRGVVGPSASSLRRWNYNSAGAGLVHAFDSRRAVCGLFASHNTQILACFPHQLD